MSITIGRHQNLLRRGDAVLLMVDMQDPFLRNIWERDALMRRVAVLLHSARILELPLMATVQNPERMGGVTPELAAILPDDLTPRHKMCFSCMGDGATRDDIRAYGRSQVILCGVETHICINQTAHDLLASGFQVHVIADAVSSRNPSDREAGLRRMEQVGAIVSCTESALYELLGQAGTPEFRAVLNLIR